MWGTPNRVGNTIGAVRSEDPEASLLLWLQTTDCRLWTTADHPPHRTLTTNLNVKLGTFAPTAPFIAPAGAIRTPVMFGSKPFASGLGVYVYGGPPPG